MNNNLISISIIMANYNYENFIGEAIDSVLNQTYNNWELIIIDDGSKDNSVEIIKSYCEKDNRIKFFQHENCENKGLKNTLLFGIEKSSNEWIAFLESDDAFTPNYLEEKVKAIESAPETGLIFNDAELIGDEVEIRGYDNYLKTREDILKNKKIKYEDLLIINIIPSFSCVMIKKDVFLSCDLNSPMPQSLDYYLWAQLYNKIRIAYVAKKLTLWRKHAINYMNVASREGHGALTFSIFKSLAGNNHNKIWFLVYKFFKRNKVEKFCRPQSNFISKFIAQNLLKNKTLEFIRI